MDYEQFKEQFPDDLKQRLNEDGIAVNVSVQEVKKLNETYDSVVVVPEGSNIGVNISMDRFFESMDNGNEYDTVVEDAVEVAKQGIEESPVIDTSDFRDYSQMKDKLVMEVVSIEANQEMLANIPHQEMEDMAVVYRFEVNAGEYGTGTVLATNDMIATLGVTPEQLHADAVENAPILKPAVITGMNEVMAAMMGRETAEMMGIHMDEEEKMYVASVPDNIHGAGVLAYEDFMDQAAERVGGDFYILPSSIHELLLVPDNGEMELSQLQDMVREVNATQVSPQDKLTDNVYHYDSQEKIFELGEKFEERQKEKLTERSNDLEDALDEKVEKGSVLGELKAKKDEVAKQPKKDVLEKAAKSKGGEAI